MHRLFILLISSCAAVCVVGDAARAGYIDDWVRAQGGCRNAISKMRFTSSPSKGGDFLAKPLIEWTDVEIDEFADKYAECRAIANTPAGIQPNPRNSNVLFFTQQRVSELRSAIEAVRGSARAQQEAVEAQDRMDAERARIAAERRAQQQARQEAGIAAQVRSDDDRRTRLRQEAQEAEASRNARLAAAAAHAKHEDEIAAEIERQAEAEEKALAESRRISESARARRQAAEQRLARIRATAETERQSEIPAGGAAAGDPEKKLSSTTSSTTSEPSGGVAAATVEKPRGCETPAMRQLLLDEFNTAAGKRDLPSAIDLTAPETESFSEKGAALEASCLYVVTLDNGTKQRFRLKVESNSLGTPFVRFQPQGTPY